MSTDIAKYFKLNTDVNYLNLRRHAYQLVNLAAKYSVVQRTFVNRIIPIWNDLPADTVNFRSLSLFKQSLTLDILVKYYKITF